LLLFFSSFEKEYRVRPVSSVSTLPNLESLSFTVATAADVVVTAAVVWARTVVVVAVASVVVTCAAGVVVVPLSSPQAAARRPMLMTPNAAKIVFAHAVLRSPTSCVLEYATPPRMVHPNPRKLTLGTTTPRTADHRNGERAFVIDGRLGPAAGLTEVVGDDRTPLRVVA